MRDEILSPPGTRMLMLGNEAIARGAIEGSVQVVAAYPGTPSSEIAETLIDVADEVGYYAEWSVNEKVAFDLAAGAALVGARSLAAMKGAGLNWAMDTFMTLPLTGVRGGFVVAVSDDPAAHYSSNEQDSRVAAEWAGMPCLEPEDQQEAKEMTKAAFALSEDIELPVLVRTVTRLSHASGVVELEQPEIPPSTIGFNKHWKIPYRWNVYGPPGPPNKHAWQLEQLERTHEWAEQTPFNDVTLADSSIGIVASGVAVGYAREALQDLDLGTKVNFWKVGVVYPLHPAQAHSFLGACEKVLVIEEGGALLEPQLRALAQEKGQNVRISGKQFEGPFTLTGELSMDQVRDVIAAFCGVSVPRDDARQALKSELAEFVIPRSSTLCAGCSHLGTYWAIRQAMQQGGRIVPIINGDIGCYEQAGYGVKGQIPDATDDVSRRDRSRSLYNMLDTLYVMGSGLAMAQGQAQAGYQDGQIVAVAGDSTFFHATMPALANAVWHGTKLTFVVMDNRWTAMTGHQPSPATTERDGAVDGSITSLDIEQAVRGLGVEWVRVVDAYRLDETIDAIQKALEYEGVSVVISRRECALQVYRRVRQMAEFTVDTELCNGCMQCVYLGCPAVAFQDSRAQIDPLLCVSCGICAQLCPQDAIIGVEA